MRSYFFAATPLPAAMTFSLVQQAVLVLLSCLILDGGELAQVCVFAVAGFWGGAVALVARRRAALSRVDLSLIRCGFLPLLILSYFLTHWVWNFRGY